MRSKDSWLKYIPPSERRGLLVKLHGYKHEGSTKMLKSLSQANTTWPRMKEEVMEYLGDCSCSRAKEDRRKSFKWQTFSEEDKASTIADDHFSFAGIKFLTILRLDTKQMWILRVEDGTREEVENVFMSWMDSMQLKDVRRILTDRGVEFTNFGHISGLQHVKTAAYHPETNGALERRHREIAKLCRIHGVMPDGLKELDLVQAILDEISEGDLVMRYKARRERTKEDDVWTGPHEVTRIMGPDTFAVRNLDNNNEYVVHRNDLKRSIRSSTTGWKLNKAVLQDECKIYPELIDIDQAVNLENIAADIIDGNYKEVTVVVPVWKERRFWKVFGELPCERYEVPNTEDAFLCSGLPVGKRNWKVDVLNVTLEDVQVYLERLATGGGDVVELVTELRVL